MATRSARDRRAQVVLLCGDAGAGKTRLLSELVQRVQKDAIVVHTAYPTYGSMGGPRVAAEVIRQLGTIEDEEVTARLRSAAGEIDASLESVDPAAMRHEQLWAFRRLLHQKSSENPLLVVIDDMHRGGDQTLALLSELAGRLDDVPLMTLLVGRTEPADWLTRFPTATKVPLGALSDTDAAVLAGAFVGTKPIDAETARILVERANGNPLYLRELVVMARERGLLVEDGESCRLVGAGEVGAGSGAGSGAGAPAGGSSFRSRTSTRACRRHCRRFSPPGSMHSIRCTSSPSNTWR